MKLSMMHGPKRRAPTPSPLKLMETTHTASDLHCVVAAWFPPVRQSEGRPPIGSHTPRDDPYSLGLPVPKIPIPDDAFCLFIHHYRQWTGHYYILHHHLVINIFMFSTFQDIICFSFRTWAFLLSGKQTEDHKRAAHASRPADDARGGRSNNSRDPGLLDWGNTTNGRDGRRRFVWLSALPRRSHSIKKKKNPHRQEQAATASLGAGWSDDPGDLSLSLLPTGSQNRPPSFPSQQLREVNYMHQAKQGESIGLRIKNRHSSSFCIR